MTAAIFGLLGVIVGGALNLFATIALQRRNEGADRRSAGRLVRSELVFFRSVAMQMSQHELEDLPQLRGASTVLWQSNRGVLARSLGDEDWALVARAYAHVDALLSVLVFDQDGRLADWRRREAQRLLAGMVEPIEEATWVLGQSDPDEISGDFPEQGPLAA